MMELKEPARQILDDYEHRVTNKINRCKDQAGFPRLEDYDIDPQDFSGYLFDKQAIMDSAGSERSQLTIGGAIVVLPVVVLACFTNDSAVFTYGQGIATTIALVIGVLLALLVKGLSKMIISYRLTKMKDPKMESYIKAVLFYEEKL